MSMFLTGRGTGQRGRGIAVPLSRMDLPRRSAAPFVRLPDPRGSPRSRRASGLARWTTGAARGARQRTPAYLSGATVGAGRGRALEARPLRAPREPRPRCSLAGKSSTSAAPPSPEPPACLTRPSAHEVALGLRNGAGDEKPRPGCAELVPGRPRPFRQGDSSAPGRGDTYERGRVRGTDPRSSNSPSGVAHQSESVRTVRLLGP
jgi:hypothetical protein